MQWASDESHKDAVLFKACDPGSKGRRSKAHRKKRTKERMICGWFMAGLPVEE
ncbi:hypothetical protein [Hungatella hathewayi]|uniref:hypothetical protein n=1 Tax=Hungatella hathewayi TaxID=154046 RepID=UPI003565A488